MSSYLPTQVAAMTDWQLAQLNIAEPLAPLDSPQLADFVANLENINSLAEKSPGYVWRLKDAAGDITNSSAPFSEDMIINLSVWDSIDSLHDYVYKTAHTDVMRRRVEWFKKFDHSMAVLWWVPQGHTPDLFESHEKLELLRKIGPSPLAFTFKQRMPKP